jgi:hypothetical protein
MSFKSVSDEVLLKEFKNLLIMEKFTKAEIVEYVHEIERRKLYIGHGRTSLYSFLTKDLGYASASAQRRIDSARLLDSVPELKQDLESGILNLTQVSMMVHAVRQKQSEEPGVQVSASEKQELLKKVKNQDTRETQKILAQELNLEIKVQEKQKIQRDESVRLEVTFSKEEMEVFQRVRELISHTNPNPTWAELLSYSARELVKRKDPRSKKHSEPNTKASVNAKSSANAGVSADGLSSTKAEPSEKTSMPLTDAPEIFNSVTKITSGPEVTPSQNHAVEATELVEDQSQVYEPEQASFEIFAATENPRFISAAKRRTVIQRDDSCRWKNKETGGMCCSKFQLEVDHIQPVWAGGTNAFENLQALCSVHNRQKYRSESGIKSQ